jgi:hypothetical protein
VLGDGGENVNRQLAHMRIIDRDKFNARFHEGPDQTLLLSWAMLDADIGEVALSASAQNLPEISRFPTDCERVGSMAMTRHPESRIRRAVRVLVEPLAEATRRYSHPSVAVH